MESAASCLPLRGGGSDRSRRERGDPGASACDTPVLLCHTPILGQWLGHTRWSRNFTQCHCHFTQCHCQFHSIFSQMSLFGVHLHIDAPAGFATFHASTCEVKSPSIYLRSKKP
jgi:hypothetical protein